VFAAGHPEDLRSGSGSSGATSEITRHSDRSPAFARCFLFAFMSLSILRFILLVFLVLLILIFVFSLYQVNVEKVLIKLKGLQIAASERERNVGT
jgi:hypothetical protein